jgi:hypothetical protein
MTLPAIQTEPLPPQGLVPANMSEAMKLAEMMANAKLVPKDLQKSPADCLLVIQQAVRWQMDPFAVAQECSVIQSKLMHSGKLVAAVVNTRGNLVERLSYTYDGKDSDRTITVTGRLQGEVNARTVTVRLADARTNNRVWQVQPDQQLMYHGVRVWARRHTPELMLGVYSPEEFDEVRRAAPAPAANVMHDPETGEIIEDTAAAEDAPRKSTATEAVAEAAARAMAADAPSGQHAAVAATGGAPAPITAGATGGGTGSVAQMMTMDEADAFLAAATKKGMAELESAWKKLSATQRKTLKIALERRHKPAAMEADADAEQDADKF